jgi:peptidoglycan/xylan/chitin deacetylase (PgdA/CDA1 family)
LPNNRQYLRGSARLLRDRCGMKKMGLTQCLLLLTVVLAMQFASPCSAFEWKDGKRAALSINYDDGFPSQRLEAASTLKEFGFPATFYLTPGRSGDV